jgi:hypothetical protein
MGLTILPYIRARPAFVMEKRTESFLDRFTATRGRPRAFQFVTVLIVLLILFFALAGAVRLLLA